MCLWIFTLFLTTNNRFMSKLTNWRMSNRDLQSASCITFYGIGNMEIEFFLKFSTIYAFRFYLPWQKTMFTDSTLFKLFLAFWISLFDSILFFSLLSKSLILNSSFWNAFFFFCCKSLTLMGFWINLRALHFLFSIFISFDRRFNPLSVFILIVHIAFYANFMVKQYNFFT